MCRETSKLREADKYKAADVVFEKLRVLHTGSGNFEGVRTASKLSWKLKKDAEERLLALQPRLDREGGEEVEEEEDDGEGGASGSRALPGGQTEPGQKPKTAMQRRWRRGVAGNAAS